MNFVVIDKDTDEIIDHLEDLSESEIYEYEKENPDYYILPELEDLDFLSDDDDEW